MDNSAQTMQNTQDIAKVTAAVGELALTVKFEMERGKEERESIKSMVQELRGLNEKMGSLQTITTEMTHLKEKIEESAKKIAILETKDESCKEWRDKHDGATHAMKIAVRAMWAVCGTGVISLGGFVLYLFFTNTSPMLVRKIGSTTYYGQTVTEQQPDEQN